MFINFFKFIYTLFISLFINQMKHYHSALFILINVFIIYIAIHQLIQAYLFINRFKFIYSLFISLFINQSNALLQRINYFHYNQKQSTYLNFVHWLILKWSQVAIVKKVNLKTLKRFIKREISITKSRWFEFLNCATLSFDLHHLKTNNWDWKKILKIKW